MPKPQPKKQGGEEFFYVDADGKKRDAELHNAILDDGDHDAAKAISDKIRARILGKREQQKQWAAAKLRALALLKDWDESKHPRGQTGPGTTPGSFAPSGGGDGGESGTSGESIKLDPKVVEVGGDAWNQATARKLEREYQQARKRLDKIANDAPKDARLTAALNKPGDAAWAALSADEKLEAFNTWRKENEIDDYDEAKETWNALTDAEKAKINAQQLSMTEEEEEPLQLYPESWDEIPEQKQDEIFESWMEDNHQKFLDDEQQQWYDSGQALGDAKNIVAWDFTKNLDSKGREWAVAALDDLQGEHIDDGTPLPFSTEQILDSMELEYEDNSGDGSDDPDMGFDATKLDKLTPKGVDPAQIDLPGMEAPPASELLTQDMRDEIVKTLTKAFNYEAEHKQVDPPEYLNDNVKEYMEEYWSSSMQDKDKFGYAHEKELIETEAGQTDSNAPSPDAMTVDALPDKFDPLNETTGQDYQRTQRLARYLSNHRARELIAERTGKRLEEVSLPTVATIDKKLWESWKGSSTSQNGILLQVATADELGGRLNTKTSIEINVLAIKTWANSFYAEIGGYAGVRAYLRAKWETTQYLLDKAGTQELELYRGIDLKRHDASRYEQAVKEKGLKQLVTVDREQYKGAKFEKAPTIKVDRNGAASTTTDFKVANNWKQGGGAVVLRALVPRTAAISIPAYGVNILSEHEVVIAGTAWKDWDAWLDRAPTFEQVPMGGRGTGIGHSAPKLAA